MGTATDKAGADTPLANQRTLFEIPKDVAYFNCASLSPLMHPAREAGEAALRRRAEPWHIAATDWFADVEERRTLFANVLGADREGIALVPATSYGLAVAARNLRAEPGQHVLVIHEDYPSNVYTWRSFARRTGCEVVTVERAFGGTWTEAVLAGMDRRTAVVAVPNVHWTDGALLDLVTIGEAARSVGAAFVVDATQSLGAMPLDLEAIRPDFLVAVGYKWLLGPFGLGYLYVAPEHRDGEPLEDNWIVREGAENFARLVDYTDRYAAGARRFDVGERTFFELTPVANACLRQVLDWGVPGIAATLRTVTGRIDEEARRLGFATLAAEERGPHMLGLRLPPDALARSAAAFSAAGVYVGVRATAVRVSPHLYTDETDLGRLFGVLKDLAR